MDNLSTFEIRDEIIDVEVINKKIMNNIMKRKESGIIPPEPDTLPLFTGYEIDEAVRGDGLSILNLPFFSENCNIQHKNYSISSHQPYIGRYLVKGRELIHGEVSRYVDPMIWKQTEFNRNVARTFDRIEELMINLDSRIKNMETEIEKRFNDKILSFISDLDIEIKNKAWLVNILEEKKDKNSAPSPEFNKLNQPGTSFNYFKFCDEVNNVPPVSFPIFNDAVHLFNNCKNVIDIGCGRGSLLQNLQNHDIGCYGIDTDENNVQFCKKNGQNVFLSDALEHLGSLDDKSLDGVFIGQVLEHMTLDTTFNVIKLIYEKMSSGSHIIIVVPNILSVIVATNYFYLDPTHTTHLHPVVLKFILKSFGFQDIQEQYYQPVSETIKLDHVDTLNSGNGISKDILKIINSNTDKLNNLLFGFMDYCVIAKK